MSDKSKIEWTDATWNPVTGCRQIPGAKGAPSGCDRCYAKTLLDTRMRANPTSARYGLPFETVLMHSERLDQPLRWKRPRRIFVNSLSDLFHEHVTDAFIAKVFATMAAAPQHSFQVLTKRPERMRNLLRSKIRASDNVWLGTSVSTKADEWRIGSLVWVPAKVRFLSVEPLLGPIELGPLAMIRGGIQWVIVGGESGRGARPMHPAWARSVRDQCAAAGVPFFFKQWGAWAEADPHEATHLLRIDGQLVEREAATQRYEGVGRTVEEDLVDRGHPGWVRVRRLDKRLTGRSLDGRTWDEFPVGAA